MDDNIYKNTNINKNKNVNENENSNLNRNENINVIKSISFRYGFLGGVISSLLASAIWYFIQQQL